MFQAAELGQTVSDREYKEREKALWHPLLMLQLKLRQQASVPVLIDFAGVRGAGKSESVNLLNKWMDARWIGSHGFEPELEEEAVRPTMWRYWMKLPPRGQLGLYLSGRYTPLLLDRVFERIHEDEFIRRVRRINIFEQMLAADGALLLKYWMHINQPTQEARLKLLEGDPDNHWRVREQDWEHCGLYDRFIEVGEQIISMTNTGHAPWEIVDAVDPNHRSLAVGESIHRHIERHISVTEARVKLREEIESSLPPDSGSLSNSTRPTTLFDRLDMDIDVPEETYAAEVETLQARAGHLQHLLLKQHRSAILVFEGPDASGKGGAIRRLIQPLDARGFSIIPIAAPTDEELRHHYLWRFWRHVPRDGHITIFDRSWYGRVLVERVEGFADEESWRRAYREINEFEHELVSHGILVLKFWIHVSKDEQLKRFKARERNPRKQWKLCEEDWRNRDRWNDYLLAAHRAISMTALRDAPWIVVEGNSKYHARLKVLSTVCKAMGDMLDKPV